MNTVIASKEVKCKTEKPGHIMGWVNRLKNKNRPCEILVLNPLFHKNKK